MDRFHSFDTHRRAYTFPAGANVTYNSCFFHHESDRTPLAFGVAGQADVAVRATNTARHWMGAVPPTVKAQQTPTSPGEIRVGFAGQRERAAPVTITCESAHTVVNDGQTIGTVHPFRAESLAPLNTTSYLDGPQMLRVTTPGGSATCLLDASKYCVGTYLLYLGNSSLISLDVNEHGFLVGGHYQSMHAPHGVTYEQEDIGGLKDSIKRTILRQKKVKPTQLTSTQQDVLRRQNLAKSKLKTLKNEYERFKNTFQYNERDKRFPRYRESRATLAIVEELNTQVEILELLAEDYEAEIKVLEEIERAVEKEIRQNLKRRVKFGKVDADGTYKKIRKNLNNVKNTAIPQIEKNRRMYEQTLKETKEADQELRRESRERADRIKQLRQEAEQDEAALRDAASDARAAAAAGGERDGQGTEGEGQGAEGERQEAEGEGQGDGEGEEGTGGGAETDDSDAPPSSVSAIYRGVERLHVGQSAGDIHEGVYLTVGNRLYKARSLAAHAPIYFQRQVAGYHNLAAISAIETPNLRV